MDAFWFDSGDAHVFGMLDVPAASTDVGTAVVICPPLGYQGVCSYRALGALARALAESGRPTLRFDWPSSGDSAGDERDAALVANWVVAVVAAADEVRRRTGAENVALVGVTIGATLAAVAATEGADVSELVLWAPHLSGAAYLREMRAFQRLASRRYPQPATPPPALPAGDEETNGFLMSAETVRDLEAVELTELRWGACRARRVLVAGADSVAPPRLVDALVSHGLEVDEARLPGVDGMLENPNTSTVPVEAFSSIEAWLSRGKPAPRTRAATGRGQTLNTDAWTETVVQLDSGGTTLVGTVTRAATEDAVDTWLVLPSAGAVRRIGPNRLWTRFARAWAAERGVSSFRLDIRGVGDSEGADASDEHFERLYTPEALNDVAVGIEYLRDHFDADRFAVAGLCSGSVAALHLAGERDDVVAGVLINPPFLIWDRQASDSTHWAHMVGQIAQARQWRRLVKGQVAGEDARRVLRSGWRALRTNYGTSDTATGEVANGEAHSDAVVRTLGRIAQDEKFLAFIFSRGDVGLTYLERQLGDAAGRLTNEFGATLDIVDGADHTFRPLWTQDRLQRLVEGAFEKAGVFERESAAKRDRPRATTADPR